jgi:hypothetical protein
MLRSLVSDLLESEKGGAYVSLTTWTRSVSPIIRTFFLERFRELLNESIAGDFLSLFVFFNVG